MPQTLTAGAAFPAITVDRLGGDQITLGQPAAGRDWQLVIVYRGLHCPLCKGYLATLEEVAPKLHALGIDVVAVSGDPADRAAAMVEETGLTQPVGHDLSVAQMQALGLYVSDPRSPQETDRPVAEPGLFVINAAGTVQIVDVSNAPFARPDLQKLAGGLEFVRSKDYPVRGPHAA